MQAKNRRPGGQRAELLDSLNREMRQASGLGTMFSQAVANRVGLSPSDLECLDLITIAGRVTAGDLSRATGLTTGAVTGVIDRLERAGFARRERDPEDRRRVYVRAEPAADAAAAPYYHSLASAAEKLLAPYSDTEISFLLDYFRKARAMMAAELEKLSSGGKKSGSDRLAAKKPR